MGFVCHDRVLQVQPTQFGRCCDSVPAQSQPKGCCNRAAKPKPTTKNPETPSEVQLPNTASPSYQPPSSSRVVLDAGFTSIHAICRAMLC